MSDSLTRRRFMAAAAGAATAPMMLDAFNAVGAPLVADADFEIRLKPARKPIKVGCIGVGGRGSSLLGELLDTKQATVVAICDVRPQRVAMAAQKCRGMNPESYSDYKKLLERDDIEAVFIATPVYLHAEMALAAIKAGKHIYCEKPLGINAKQAAKVYKAASKSDKVFQIGFQWHYNRNFKAAIDAVHAGHIGEVKYIHAARNNPGDIPDGWEGWYKDRKRSGDIIVEQAIHEINVFCWGMKAHPTKAVGMGGINYFVDQPKGRTVMDNYSLTYLFEGGCRVSYSHMFFAHKPLGGMHIHFFGTEGAVDVMGGKIYRPDGKAIPPLKMALSPRDTYNGIVSFFRDVATGGKPAADAKGALWATKTAVLGRSAIYNEEAVRWKDIG